MKNLVIVLLVILAISGVSAINITEEVVNGVVVPDLNYPATFSITVSDFVPGNYNIYTLTDVDIEPKTLTLSGADKQTFEIKVRALDSLDVRKPYTFSYTFKEVGVAGKRVDSKMTVRVLDVGDFLKIESEEIGYDSDEIKLIIENEENVEISNLKVKFSSLLF